MSCCSHAAAPRPTDVSYDESRVAVFSLPDPLALPEGERVATAEDWFGRRRPELLELFLSEMYGRAPGFGAVDVATAHVEPGALSGLATRWEVDVHIRADPDRASHKTVTARLLVWVPNKAQTAAPAWLGLNLLGNHTVHPDPSIRLAEGWTPLFPDLGISEGTHTEAARGMRAGRWPVELIVSRGYALATLYSGDIDPDFDDDCQNGVHGLFEGGRSVPRARDAWGTIAAWSWGLCRALDALECIDGIDPKRIGLVGHSRLGKAALWAAAQDTRFAWVASSCSGRGGAAISRRRFGELTRHLNQRFPHWFARSFRDYDDNEQALPVDQHELLGLIAPRPVYVQTAAQDLWSDPQGQLLACQGAGPVYRLLGAPGLVPEGTGRVGYHCRPGGHDLLVADWWRFLDFADGQGCRG